MSISLIFRYFVISIIGIKKFILKMNLLLPFLLQIYNLFLNRQHKKAKILSYLRILLIMDFRLSFLLRSSQAPCRPSRLAASTFIWVSSMKKHCAAGRPI